MHETPVHAVPAKTALLADVRLPPESIRPTSYTLLYTVGQLKGQKVRVFHLALP